MTGREPTLPSTPDHWTTKNLYVAEVHGEHVLELEWTISAEGEQPVDADGNELPLPGTLYYGAHVGVEVSDLRYTDADANYDVGQTVQSTWLSPERALEVAWHLAAAAQACSERIEASR